MGKAQQRTAAGRPAPDVFNAQEFLAGADAARRALLAHSPADAGELLDWSIYARLRAGWRVLAACARGVFHRAVQARAVTPQCAQVLHIGAGRKAPQRRPCACGCQLVSPPPDNARRSLHARGAAAAAAAPQRPRVVTVPCMRSLPGPPASAVLPPLFSCFPLLVAASAALMLQDAAARAPAARRAPEQQRRAGEADLTHTAAYLVGGGVEEFTSARERSLVHQLRGYESVDAQHTTQVRVRAPHFWPSLV